MEVAYKKENKGTKYNHVAPIDLDTIPMEEREQALMEFAEGSKGLEACLRAMWGKCLKTHACCAGNDDLYETAYIAMSKNVDLFSYLSLDILRDELVKIEETKNGQAIYIAGKPEHIENTFYLLAGSILSGKKNNDKEVKEKIGKEFPLSWIKEANAYHMLENGYTDEEIAFHIRGLELNWIMAHGTVEEMKKILPEYREYARTLLERMVSNNQNRK